MKHRPASTLHCEPREPRPRLFDLCNAAQLGGFQRLDPAVEDAARAWHAIMQLPNADGAINDPELCTLTFGSDQNLDWSDPLSNYRLEARVRWGSKGGKMQDAIFDLRQGARITVEGGNIEALVRMTGPAGLVGPTTTAFVSVAYYSIGKAALTRTEDAITVGAGPGSTSSIAIPAFANQLLVLDDSDPLGAGDPGIVANFMASDGVGTPVMSRAAASDGEITIPNGAQFVNFDVQNGPVVITPVFLLSL